MIHWLFASILFSLHIFVFFTFFFLIIYLFKLRIVLFSRVFEGSSPGDSLSDSSEVLF